MKFLIATDIHGSDKYFNILLKAIERESPDKVILLGDYFYHGPRNPFPDDYAPMKVAESMKNLGDKLILVKGNCDSEVDEMVSEREFLDSYTIDLEGKLVLCTHGHKISKYDTLKSSIYTAVINGHYHVNDYEYIDSVHYFTIASISLPKDGYEAAYAVVEKDLITIKNLEGKMMIKKSIET